MEAEGREMSAEIINLTSYILTLFAGIVAGIGTVRIARWLKNKRDYKDATEPRRAKRNWRQPQDGGV